MKRIFLALIAGLLVAPVMAQEEGERSHRGKRPGPRHHDGVRPGPGDSGHDKDRDRRFHGGHRGSGPKMDGQFLEKWLSYLQKNDPSFYEEMQKLQRENPKDFQRAIRDRLNQRRMEMHLNRDPELKQILDSLEPKARKKIMACIGRSAPPPFMEPSRKPSDHPFSRTEEKTIKLAAEYRKASAPEDRDRIRQELKNAIVTAYDARREDRMKMLRKMEQEIERIKASIQDRNESREQIIKQRLDQLLQEAPAGREQI